MRRLCIPCLLNGLVEHLHENVKKSKLAELSASTICPARRGPPRNYFALVMHFRWPRDSPTKNEASDQKNRVEDK